MTFVSGTQGPERIKLKMNDQIKNIVESHILAAIDDTSGLADPHCMKVAHIIGENPKEAWRVVMSGTGLQIVFYAIMDGRKCIEAKIDPVSAWNVRLHGRSAQNAAASSGVTSSA